MHIEVFGCTSPNYGPTALKEFSIFPHLSNSILFLSPCLSTLCNLFSPDPVSLVMCLSAHELTTRSFRVGLKHVGGKRLILWLAFYNR